jgi:hypothetical protein
MSTFTVETTGLPVVDIAFHGTLTEADCVGFFATLNEVCTPGQRVATLVDYRGLDPFAMTATVRQSFARAFFDGIDGRRAATLCEARVVDNALTRGFIVAFDWVTGSKWPCASFPTREEAVAWVNEQVAKDGKVREASSSAVFSISPESGEPELRKAG